MSANFVLYVSHVAKSMDNIQEIPTASSALTAHPFSKYCAHSMKQGITGPCGQYLALPSRREFHSSESLRYGTNYTNNNHKSLEYNSSIEIPCCFRDTTPNFSWKTTHHCLRYSKSLSSLNNEVMAKRSIHKEYTSYNSLINEEEDYVIDSMYPTAASLDVNGYLKLLSDCNDYEEIDDRSIKNEPDYCVIGDIDVY